MSVILSHVDSLHAAQIFIDYYTGFDRIDDYLRKVKLERIAEMPTSLPGMGPEDDMFSDFTMNPEDMEFEVRVLSNELFDNYLEITTSHALEKSIPGKTLKWVVYEKNTNKIVGFIRFGSPTINSKPRNEMLGRPLDTMNKEVMKRFNDSVIMGFTIVPTQPFGFNYLGGKLLAAICCSHKARRDLNKKYTGTFCGFETTSLYGSSKTASQYDGMKPFLRFKGLTDSDFVPSINDEKYRDLKFWFENKNNGVPLVHDDASSRKMKTQQKMISIIKNSLNKHDKEKLKEFQQTFIDAKALTEQKRQYFSNYGYENVVDFLNLETDTLKKAPNYDRYEMDEVVKWWKKLAGKRYSKLKSEDRLRTDLETWNVNADEIDIIR
tara:strand:+ start:761 stop:1897 length:1137 start_codon:yes stop_codon:yes gene_type:complete